jgi:hypothetical protein
MALELPPERVALLFGHVPDLLEFFGALWLARWRFKSTVSVRRRVRWR